jgi:magnesium-transporting ATPase (P-type)
MSGKEFFDNLFAKDGYRGESIPKNKPEMENFFKDRDNKMRFQSIIKDLRVLTRANSFHKQILVLGLECLNKTVATTGEGINDIEAITQSTVGISMGSGVSACKNQSSLILINDDFEALLRAIMWGRNIYHNMQRFLQFQITCNVTCLLTIFIGNIMFDQPPISSVQLLWINVIMDLFGALALSTEPPHKSVIDGKPMPKDIQKVSILNNIVWRQIIGISLYNTIILVFVMFLGRWVGDLPAYARNISTLTTEPVGFGTRTEPSAADTAYIGAQSKAIHLTYVFNIFVFLQMFNMINCRKVGRTEFNVFDSFTHNTFFLVFFLLTGVVQFIGTQYFSTIFHTTPLSRTEWGTCICIGSTVLVASALIKLTPESWVEKFGAKHLINED